MVPPVARKVSGNAVPTKAGGMVGVVIWKVMRVWREKLVVAISGVGAVVSVTWTVKGKVPRVVGDPARVPSAVRVRPGGRTPVAIDQRYGGVPPAAARVCE